jgi:uncharacterized protein
MPEQVSDSADVIDNTDASRFELRADGWLAELVYRVRGDRLVLVHTEVPFELEGRGIGGRLATAAVDRAAREGLTLVPLCPFARGWLERHPEAASRAVIATGTVERHAAGAKGGGLDGRVASVPGRWPDIPGPRTRDRADGPAQRTRRAGPADRCCSRR